MEVPAAGLSPLSGALSWAVPVVATRVERGDLAVLPLGELLRAVVVRVTPREAVLHVQGRELVVRSVPGLQPGTIWLVRRPGGETHPWIECLPANPDTAAFSPDHLSGSAPLRSGSNTTATLEVAAVPTASTAQKAADVRSGTVQSTLQLVVVEAELAPQLYQIHWGGQTHLARSTQPLLPGWQHLVQVHSKADGLWLTLPAETPDMPTVLATALVRQLPPADLGPALADLHQLLTAVLSPFSATGKQSQTLSSCQPGGVTSSPCGDSPILFAGAQTGADNYQGLPPVPSAAHESLARLHLLLKSFWPDQWRPLNADELQRLLQSISGSQDTHSPTLVPTPAANGPSAHTKSVSTVAGAATTLAEQTPAGTDPFQGISSIAPSVNLESSPGGSAPSPTAVLPSGDLRHALLQVLHTLPAVSSAPVQQPVLALLHGLTSLQAINLLAQQQGHPYWLQLPFPDGNSWRTLHLAVEPDAGLTLSRDLPETNAAATGPAERFHILIHAPLETLGETWIDMSLSAGRLHAVLYFERADTLQQAQAQQHELVKLLQESDFSDIGVDFRPATDLPRRHQQQAAAMRTGHPPSLNLLDCTI